MKAVMLALATIVSLFSPKSLTPPEKKAASTEQVMKILATQDLELTCGRGTHGGDRIS